MSIAYLKAQRFPKYLICSSAVSLKISSTAAAKSAKSACFSDHLELHTKKM